MRAVLTGWCVTHSATASALWGLSVIGMAWCVAGFAAQDRLANPMGDSFVAVRLTLLVPVVATAAVPVVLHDRIHPDLARSARSLRAQRAAWWLVVVVGLALSLMPLAGTVGFGQVALDVGLLAGLSTLVQCALGLGAAMSVPMLVLLPHLIRSADAPATWWSVLDGPHPAGTGSAAAGVAVAGLLAYALRGPRPGRTDAGDGHD